MSHPLKNGPLPALGTFEALAGGYHGLHRRLHCISVSMHAHEQGIRGEIRVSGLQSRQDFIFGTDFTATALRLNPFVTGHKTPI